jgi:hypothetical protein
MWFFLILDIRFQGDRILEIDIFQGFAILPIYENKEILCQFRFLLKTK